MSKQSNYPKIPDSSNQSELDEILAKHGAEAGEMTHSLKQAILDWHNKQIEVVLDRLENNIRTGMVKVSVLDYIEAERNKLKESSSV